MSDLADELEKLRDMLASVIERLDDLAIRELRSALDRKESTRPDSERQISRARNQLTRAIGLLRIDESADDKECD